MDIDCYNPFSQKNPIHTYFTATKPPPKGESMKRKVSDDIISPFVITDCETASKFVNSNLYTI